MISFFLILNFPNTFLESNIDIRARIANSESDSLEALYREWNSLRQYIAKAYNLTTEGRKKVGIDLDSLEKKAYGLERKMGRLSVKLPSSFQQKTPLDYEHLKKNLKSDEVFIDFVAWTYYHPIYGVGEKSYSALVIRPDDDYPQWVYLTNESTLQKVLKGEVELNGSNYITDKVEAEYLYELIWLPIEDLVLDMKHLYLSPSSLLNKVAFGALLTDYDQGKRLIEDKQIHYFSTLRDFFYTKQEVKKGEETADIVLVGGIDFGNTEKDSTSTQNQSRGHYGAFSYLEGTKKEVDSIQHQFEHYCWDIQKLEDKNASEEQIKQLGGENAPKILHVATHGFFIDNKNKSVKAQNKLETQTHPLMRSGIALSGANNAWLGKKELDAHTDDGILTAYEVSNMDLHQTNLVVLSACETGRGDIDNTEGVMGLQRAFKIAGVDQMIISLWKVPDKQTYELMTFFYDNYLRGDTAHQAFQKAQQKMNKKYENPYYWAAFVLIE
ncbi:MAG: CHAT domain-containing protein [Aureispira sp.]|nr:CHAT domain-containing protein [Aureispira sp.]